MLEKLGKPVEACVSDDVCLLWELAADMVPNLGFANIQDVAGESGLDQLGILATRSHPVTHDRLESEERVLGSGLSMVADLLLPLPWLEPRAM